MKKLLILCFVLFLSSCSSGDIEMINVYFTSGGPSDLAQIEKYSNFTEYSSALEDSLRLQDYSENFDDEFFSKYDLIVVQFVSFAGRICQSFSLNGIQTKDNQLTVSITDLYNYDSLDPILTANNVYTYLIVIDKTDIEEVILIMDNI